MTVGLIYSATNLAAEDRDGSRMEKEIEQVRIANGTERRKEKERKNAGIKTRNIDES